MQGTIIIFDIIYTDAQVSNRDSFSSRTIAKMYVPFFTSKTFSLLNSDVQFNFSKFFPTDKESVNAYQNCCVHFLFASFLRFVERLKQ